MGNLFGKENLPDDDKNDGNEENDAPLDNIEGSKADQLLDISKVMIERVWKDVFESGEIDKIPLDKLEQYLRLSYNAWNLVNEVLDVGQKYEENNDFEDLDDEENTEIDEDDDDVDDE